MRLEKNILKQYDSVLKEITETDRRILKTQAKIERMLIKEICSYSYYPH